MRYLAHTPLIREQMLRAMGVSHVDDLFRDIPSTISQSPPFDLPHHQDEWMVDRYFSQLARENLTAEEVPSFLGAGLYRHHIPATVDALIQRGEFLTSYTPYQPEISQGTLQYLFEFQTQVTELTGMEVANASMYDGSTATVEAVMMANRLTGRRKAVLSGALHPHYAAVVQTYGRYCNFDVLYQPIVPEEEEELSFYLSPEISCLVVQYPDVFGRLNELSLLASQCQAQGVLLIVVVTEILALGLVISPGAMGADIVVGEGQSLGNAVSFGGPTVGLFATREAYVRQMPGRLVGETVDIDGRRSWVLTLSAREQHIRREKATSNICTNSGLCALAFTIHLSLLGAVGYQRLAKLNHHAALTLVKEIETIPGVCVMNRTFFNEVTVRLPGSAADIVDRLVEHKVLAGVPLSRLMPNCPGVAHDLLIAATELTTRGDIVALKAALQEVLK